jgi:hypothetical protein
MVRPAARRAGLCWAGRGWPVPRQGEAEPDPEAATSASNSAIRGRGGEHRRRGYGHVGCGEDRYAVVEILHRGGWAKACLRPVVTRPCC